MIVLEVENFSCITSARLEIAPVTVLIGQQGSGKSLLAKLTYFFCDLLITQFYQLSPDTDFRKFEEKSIHKFEELFSPSAWGPGLFVLRFQVGVFSAELYLKEMEAGPERQVCIEFSEAFINFYQEFESVFEPSETHRDLPLSKLAQASMELRNLIRLRISSILNNSYIENQIFVPASRALFTAVETNYFPSLGRGFLDPVTVSFAALISVLRDPRRRQANESASRRREDESRKIETVMNSLLGGMIEIKNGIEYVTSNDNRSVAFSRLSSAQQEILPLWLIIENFMADPINELGGSSWYNSNQLIYMEEIEAHLFPVSQNVVLGKCIEYLLKPRFGNRLVLTTHSPYILSILNNFLKAGTLAQDETHAADVEKIVPRACWLTPDRVRSYAIVDGVLTNIMNDDGLIDGNYIDSVSEDISQTFNALLDIQYPDSVQ